MNSERKKNITIPPVTRKNRIIVNIDHHHPSIHGVLQLILSLDGEDVIDYESILDYLHIGMVQIAKTEQLYNIYCLNIQVHLRHLDEPQIRNTYIKNFKNRNFPIKF
jgi:NADH:ubiquinone oxidoreductase subunit D